WNGVATAYLPICPKIRCVLCRFYLCPATVGKKRMFPRKWDEITADMARKSVGICSCDVLIAESIIARIAPEVHKFKTDKKASVCSGNCSCVINTAHRTKGETLIDNEIDIDSIRRGGLGHCHADLPKWTLIEPCEIG